MRFAAAATAALVATSLGPVGSAPSAAATTCDGQLVTITGAPGQHVTGTSGDDVIRTNGARSVDALAGDDRVCVTGPAREYVDVLAGDGADRVFVLLDDPAVRVTAWLGDGADVFKAGATADAVEASGGVADDDVDQIETGAHHDRVDVGSPGVDVADIVSLGGGNDSLSVRGTPVPGHSFRGGRGSDSLRPGVTPGAGHLVFDNVLQQARLNGVPVQEWVGFEAFDLSSGHDQSVAFVGGPADERVSAPGSGSGPLVRASMGGGDDELDVTERKYLPEDARRQSTPYDGGPGRDRLAAGVPQDDLDLDDRITADLELRTVVAENDGDRDVVRIRRFEDLRVWGDAVTLRGHGWANTLEAIGCTVTMTGRGGADLLASPARLENHNGCRRGMTMWGGSGPDRLVGRAGDDRLVGGTGYDRAYGNDGRDLCRAEVRVRCERR